jgi:hypothetical protein
MQIKTGNSETLTTLDIHKSGVYIYIYILYRQIKTGNSETLTTLDIDKSGIYKYIYIVQLVMNHSYIS